MNIRKITAPIKQEIILLFKAGIPIKLIAGIFDFAIKTVMDAIPKELKNDAEDFKETTNEKRLNLLKIYAWLLADEQDCAAGIGTPAIGKAREIIFKYLNLKNWEQFLDGIVMYKNLSECNRYNPDVNENYQKLIEDILPYEKIKLSGKEYLEQALIAMHNGEFMFPKADSINDPAKALQLFVEKKLSNGQFLSARFFTGKFVEQLDLLIATRSEREIDFIKAPYNLSEETVQGVADRYGVGLETVRASKNRALQRIFRRIWRVIDCTIGERLIEQKKFEDSEQDFQQKLIGSTALYKALLTNHGQLQDDFILLKRHINKQHVDPEKLNRILIRDTSKTIGDNDPIKQALSTPLEDLDLSVRAFNCIRAARINSLIELVTYEQQDLMQFRNFGQKSLSEIEQVLQERGLSFGMKIV